MALKSRKSITASLLFITSTIAIAALRRLRPEGLSSLLALGFFSVSISTHAQRYVEISAQIELVSYPAGEPNGAASAKPRTISFVCITGTNEWRIENDFVRSAEDKWFFDGTNVYNSLHATRPASEEGTDRIAKTSEFANVPFERAKSNLTINIRPSHDGHPLGDVSVNIPWLAFCSGTYLKRDGRLIPLPASILHHTRDRFAYTDKTETFEDAFGLPRTVDLFTSKSLYQASNDGFDKEYFSENRYMEWAKKIASNLQEGVLMFHYAVTESTNFLGLNFPTRFEFFQNGRKHEQNGDWFCRGIGRVKSIRPSAKPESLFVPSLQQTIVDWRFRDAATSVDSIIYIDQWFRGADHLFLRISRRLDFLPHLCLMSKKRRGFPMEIRLRHGQNL